MATSPSTNGYLGAGWKGTGSLTIQDGITVNSDTGVLGYWSGTTGSAIVRGIGSTWNSNGVSVGSGGSGTLSINSGGVVNSAGIGSPSCIGDSAGAIGVAAVDGESGSTWITNELVVGVSAKGTLSVLTAEGLSRGWHYQPQLRLDRHGPGQRHWLDLDQQRVPLCGQLWQWDGSQSLAAAR